MITLTDQVEYTKTQLKLRQRNYPRKPPTVQELQTIEAIVKTLEKCLWLEEASNEMKREKTDNE